MLSVRTGATRGATRAGWLDSRHTFSFADYYDPQAMGFRVLRVLNEDRVAPGQGFPTHGHRDMEIVSYVLAGALEHQDSMGNGSVIRPGDVQRMTAGTGVRHSEQNASRDEPVHFLQIWLLPERAGLAPGYEQRAFPEGERRGQLRLVGSSDGRDGSVTVHQDVSLYLARLWAGDEARHPIAPGRSVYVHVARGEISVNGRDLGSGDGASLSGEAARELRGRGNQATGDEIGDGGGGEALVFDLA
jgi:quercetin 2,3-dioxygenase